MELASLHHFNTGLYKIYPPEADLESSIADIQSYLGRRIIQSGSKSTMSEKAIAGGLFQLFERLLKLFGYVFAFFSISIQNIHGKKCSYKRMIVGKSNPGIRLRRQPQLDIFVQTFEMLWRAKSKMNRFVGQIKTEWMVSLLLDKFECKICQILSDVFA